MAEVDPRKCDPDPLHPDDDLRGAQIGRIKRHNM
jgi:hypothetical protein